MLGRSSEGKVEEAMPRKNRRRHRWNQRRPPAPSASDEPFSALELDFFQRGEEEERVQERLFAPENSLSMTGLLINPLSSL
jgi:hypothetical protein